MVKLKVNIDFAAKLQQKNNSAIVFLCEHDFVPSIFEKMTIKRLFQLIKKIPQKILRDFRNWVKKAYFFTTLI